MVTVRAETTSNPGTRVMRSKDMKGQNWRSYLLPATDSHARPVELFQNITNSTWLNLVRHTMVAL